MNIENTIYPENGKLILEEETFTAKILDAELDVLECSFNNDECVTIETEGLSYIVLSYDNLETLKRLISISEKKYKQINK